MAAPIKNTCPDIDKLQKKIRQLRHDLKYVPDDLSDVKSAYSDIDDLLYDISSGLEDLRSSNDTLRQWGNEMENAYQAEQDRVSDLENIIYELQQAASNPPDERSVANQAQ